MYVESVDFKRPSWESKILGDLLTRLIANGYQGLLAEVHQAAGRFSRPRADRSLPASLGHADGFADVLIPPAQPHTRVIFFLAQPDLLRMVVAGRNQTEVRRVATATKLHLEAAVGGHISELLTDVADRDGPDRFRREVVPALNLTATGGLVVGLRDGAPMQMMLALRRQPAFRGRPTALGSQLSTLLPDKPSEQAREAMERLVSSKIVERWHVLICRQGGQWLAVAPGLDEIKSFIGSNVACPHCGTRMGEEIQEVAYRLTEAADAQLADNRPLCELLDAALRRAGAEAVVIDPGRGALDGAAFYRGTVLVFRARQGAPSAEETAQLLEQARVVEQQGWRVVSLLVCDQPAPADLRQSGVFVVDNISRLDAALEEILSKIRQQQASALLPPVLRPLAISVADLLPPE